MTILTNRWVHIFILLALLSGMVFVRTQDVNWSYALRNLAFDTYNRLYPRAPSDAVVVVDIDEASLEKPALGQWPWSRVILADLVRALDEYGAHAIIFDMVFAEEDRTQPFLLADMVEKYDGGVAQSLRELPDNNALFAQAIQDAGNVVTGFVFTSAGKSQEAFVKQPMIRLSKDAQILRETLSGKYSDHVVNNMDVITRAAAGNGHFSAEPQVDGIIRNLSLLIRGVDREGHFRQFYPALSIEALRVAQGTSTFYAVQTVKNPQLLDPPFTLRVGQYNVPLDYNGNFHVYFSRQRGDQYIPAWTIFEGKIDPARVKDKIVLIGTSAIGLKDIRSTPLDLYVPGVEVHVNVIEQILSGQYLLRPHLVDNLELLTLAVAGGVLIFVAPFVNVFAMAAMVFLLIVSGVGLSLYAFLSHGLLLDPVYIGLSLLSLYIVSSILTYIRSESERRQVRQAFGLYISPDYMKELTSNPDKLQLGGEVREMSVMFTDIRSFTTISESLSPAALIQLMNDFLTPMSDLVMKNRGTIDKYMGDAMMAFWNAPLDDADHARHACLAALQMNDALAPINERLAMQAEGEGRAPIILQAGIGVNTGKASVGNMGSRQRFAYSVLGDTVNLASRLEGQTKTYGVNILIGEETYQHVSDMAALELDLLRVKGKVKPVRVYTLLGDEIFAQNESFVALQATHAAMIASYRAGDFESALALAGQCRTAGEARLEFFYDLYETRIAELIKHRPASDWDGVFIATSK